MKTLFSNFNLSPVSKKRIDYFWQIEEMQSFIFKQFIQIYKIPVFIDIGANVGAYTLLGAKLPEIQMIYAFEPNPAGFNELSINTHIFNNVSLFNKIVSSEPGKAEYLDFGKISGKNGVRETNFHKTANATILELEKDQLDNMLNIRYSQCYIKIDVEGHEPAVILGSEEILSENKVIIQIEIEHHQDKITKLLKYNNFDLIFKLGPDGYFSNFPITEIEKNNILVNAINECIEMRWL